VANQWAIPITRDIIAENNHRMRARLMPQTQILQSHENVVYTVRKTTTVGGHVQYAIYRGERDPESGEPKEGSWREIAGGVMTLEKTLTAIDLDYASKVKMTEDFLVKPEVKNG
jgi:hypothetical protein